MKVFSILFVVLISFFSERVEAVEVKFVARELPRNFGPIVLKAGEETSEKFTLPTKFFSDPIEVGVRQLVLIHAADEKVVAKIALPETGSKFAVLLVPGSKETFRAVIVNAARQAFRPGEFFLQNDFNASVLAKVGDTKMVIESGAGKILKPTGAREGCFYDVLLGVRKNKKTRKISESRWPVATTTRTYVFFYMDRKTKDIEFHAMDEYVPPAKG